MNPFHTQSVEFARLNVKPEHAAASFITQMTDKGGEFLDSVDAGVEAAMDEIDKATFCVVVAQVRTVWSMEVEAQAKRLALQMIRDLAADNKKEEQVPF
jgi:hypothetical protein